MDVINMIWEYRIQLIPILVAISTYELAFLIWRLCNRLYFPIYFSIIPTAELNLQFTRYSEMFSSCDEHRSPSKKDVKKKFRLIRKLSRLALAISMYAIPGYVGITTAFYLDKPLFLQFIIVFSLYKIIQLVVAIINGNGFFYPNTRVGLVAIIYSAFIIVTTLVLFTTHSHMRGFLESGSWNSVMQYIFIKIGGFVSSLVLTFIVIPELEISVIKRKH